jgi:hypothetical protein
MNVWFLICIGVFVLFGLVLIFTLVRGIRVVQDGLKEQAADGPQEKAAGEANTRWAHGDTALAPDSMQKPQAMVICPSCGGENPNGANVCAYCGGNL